MARNDTIALKLVADNNDLRKKLAASERSLKGYERRVQRMGKGTGAAFKGTAGSIAATGGAAFAASKAFDFLKGSVSTTEELTKASVKLSKITGADIATSAQFVQATKARGVSTKQLTTGFVTLSKQITQAQKGTGKAALAFDKLGVSQAAIAKGDTKTVLMQMSDGLSRIGNPAERAALAQQMLGRSGKDLIGLLSGGSAELQKQLGLYKGSSAEIAANKDSVMNLAANQRKLKAATDNLRVSLGVALMPVLEAVTAVLVKFSNLSPGMKKAIMTLIGIGAAVIAINKVKQAFIALRIVMLTNPFTALATAVLVIGVLIYKNWGKIRAFLGRTWGAIKGAVRSLANTIVSWAKRGFLGPVGWIIANWNRVVGFMRGLVGRIGGIAKRIAGALWGGIKRGAGSILGVVKSVLNGVLGGLESGINLIIRGLNTAIGLFNRLPGKDIGKIGRVSFPRLAQGGVISRATFAMVGEDGPEAVVPLSKPRRARAVMAQAGLTGGGNNYFTINTTGSVDEQALAAKIGWQLATRGIA